MKTLKTFVWNSSKNSVSGFWSGCFYNNPLTHGQGLNSPVTSFGYTWVGNILSKASYTTYLVIEDRDLTVV
jgi:hypothetical protein